MPRKRAPQPLTPAQIAGAIAGLTSDAPRVPAIADKDLLSTGCAVLNKAFSGRVCGGIPKGNYVFVVGDSGTLKTFLGLNLFAEAALSREFDDYDFVFDNAEHGALMDIRRYFGQSVADRMIPPAGDVEDPVYSETVQQFYYNLEICCRKPCIYLLDSMDALNDDSEEEKFEAELHYYETGKGKDDIPGSMGMQKAKTNSKNINRVVKNLRRNGSILIILSQTRDKLGARFPTKTRSGGHALQFFAHLQLWTSKIADIAPTYHGKDRTIGSRIKVDIRKNRVCGFEDPVEVHHLKEWGIDDLGTSVAYLMDEKHWKKPVVKVEKGVKKPPKEEDDEGAPKRIYAPEFDFEGTPEALIRKIQDECREDELAAVVSGLWDKIREAVTPVRKPKYR